MRMHQSGFAQNRPCRACGIVFYFCCALVSLTCGKFDPVQTLKFNPADGTMVREPEKGGRGYWVGAPGVLYDQDKELFYLTYRYHTHDCYPNTSIMKRGHIARIASSQNGVEFVDIKEFRNEDFHASSLGRASLIKTKDGIYRYFMCHDNLDETQWVIGVLSAPRIEELKPDAWQPAFTSGEATKESLRDPYVLFHDDVYYLLVTIERIRWPENKGGDKYAGVTVKRSTGYATSTDGIHFDWKGEIFKPLETGWDSDCRRITSVLPLTEQLVAFYDGSSGYENNHEDMSALAAGLRIDALTPVDPQVFRITSPWGTGSCRFVDVTRVRGTFYIYYECCRRDESHDLRVMIK